MNARLGLLVAVLLGAAAKASANPASGQARSALDTPRVYDGTLARAEAAPVYAGDPAKRPALNPEQTAAEEQRRVAARANLSSKPIGKPTEVPHPKKEPLTSWNPLLNGAKGALLLGIVGFVLGGPLGLMVGAAVGGMAAWGLTKIDNA